MMSLHPTNEEVASLLDELATYLELEGENPFKIKAYKNAANVILGMEESISELVIQGKNIKSIPGIGTNIEKKILEIVKTGTLSHLEKLRNKYPSGLFDLLKIPGLGIKKIKTLYEEFNIATPNDLMLLAKQGKISELPGFGKKSQEKLILALEEYLRANEKFNYWEIKFLVDQFIELIKTFKIKALLVGSFRRKKAVISDVDILILDSQKTNLIELLHNFAKQKNGEVYKIEDRYEINLPRGLNFKIIFSDEKKWGLDIIKYTGSKDFIETLEKYAEQEVNITDIFDYKPLFYRSEEEIFQFLGLQYIPPELREDNGEIYLAKDNNLPKLIEYSELKGDLHVHTNYTDGKNSIEEMVHAAMSKGFEYIGITDHSKRLKIVGGLDESKLISQMEEIDKINEKYKDKIKIFKGVEVDILEDGSLDLSDSVLKELDYVIASIHSKFNLSKKEQTNRLKKAMDNPYVTIIGHPTGRLIGKRTPYLLDIIDLLDHAKNSGSILELNSQPDRLDLNEDHLRLAKELDIKIAINSDAHSIYGFDVLICGIHQARRGWIEKEDVVNTYSLNRLEDFFKNKK